MAVIVFSIELLSNKGLHSTTDYNIITIKTQLLY